ncbi:hypothetical protein D3Q23_14530 [Salmonella enterica]|nr:hypothetical protein [Salmonella enterica]
MTAMLKSLRFIPLCVLIFTGGASAAHVVAAKSSDNSLVSYSKVIRDVIDNQLGDVSDIYEGKACLVRLGFSRDATVLYSVAYDGDSDLCNNVISAIHSIKKFPPFPSEMVYQSLRDCTIDFKL